MFGLTNFVRPNILKTKILHLSKQDMELLMQEFHMYLLDIESRPKLNGQHDNREMSCIRLEAQNHRTVSAGLSTSSY